MPTHPRHRSEPRPAEPRTLRVGCVSYLNSKPLIEGVEEAGGPGDTPPPAVRFDVPSRLMEDLETGAVDIALCPVIDYFRAAQPLRIVPVGGIGSQGRTFTVRLYSKVPIEAITAVHADTDSHTSVALLRVLLRERWGLTPPFIDYHAREHVADHRLVESPAAMLLIGDKVVNDSPPAVLYPHQLDLGEAWRELTGLPFVFAVWMCRAGADLGDLPVRLRAQREHNRQHIPAIAEKYAPRHGWPVDLARHYLGELLHYGIGPQQLQAIERFGQLAHQAGLIGPPRPLALWP